MSTHREETIFQAAREIRDAIARAAFLDQACAGDGALRAAIDALLSAQTGEPTQILPESGPARLTPLEKAGDTIGRYKLLQQIGEGGCGVVYMAEQSEPVRRKVALKVIKVGMDTKKVIARFDAERQALAMMDHQNIARVLDAGATSAGRPYFVMELVRGVPITKYCDENNLPAPQRLDLFIAVCHAIQHAHQKGIIHRDIKPSNILVTLHDGVPVPKVIDFGIAKATEARLTDLTLFTELHAFIGTPAYTSPEQAEMSGLDIDTRADIYSLGVLLYELLSGRLPFDPAKLLQAGLDEMRRTIREVEPPRPSTRLSTLTDAERTAIAKHRGLEPGQLSSLLRGDLDWIVMKTLEKDRTRRYDTANGLAQDIQRYLGNEPVNARPPSTAYLLGKLLRRHRGAFAVGLSLMVTAIMGFLLLIFGHGFIRGQQAALQAAEASHKATSALGRERQAAALAGQAAALAAAASEREQAEAARAIAAAKGERAAHEETRKQVEITQGALSKAENSLQRLVATQKKIEGLLETIAPLLSNKSGPLILERAEELVQGISSETTDDPRIRAGQAGLLRVCSRLYIRLGDGGKAVAQAEKARDLILGELKRQPDDPTLRRQLFDIYNLIGEAILGGRIAEDLKTKYQKAKAAHREALAIAEAEFHAHPGNAEWRKLYFYNLNLLGDVAAHSGNREDALTQYREAQARLADYQKSTPGCEDCNSFAAAIHDRLGTLCYDQHDTAGARKEFDISLRLLEHESGDTKPEDFERQSDLSLIYNEFGNVLMQDEKWADALTYYQHALTIRKTLCVQAPRLEWQRDLGFTTSNVAMAFWKTKQYKPAIDVFQERLKLAETLFNEDRSNPNLRTDYTNAMSRLADILLNVSDKSLQDWPKALELAQSAATLTERRDPRQLALLAQCQRLNNQPDAARRSIKEVSELLPPENKRTTEERMAAEEIAYEFSKLASSYAATGNVDKAFALWTESSASLLKDTSLALTIATLQLWFGKDADYAATSRRMLELAAGTDAPSTAERAAKSYCLKPSTDPQLLGSAVTLARRAVELGKNHRYLPWYQMALGLAQYRSDHFPAADEALGSAEKGGKDDPQVKGTVQFFHAMSLFRQGKEAEARKLFAEAEAQMKPLPADERQPLAGAADADDVIVWLAYKETRALLKTTTPPVSPK